MREGGILFHALSERGRARAEQQEIDEEKSQALFTMVSERESLKKHLIGKLHSRSKYTESEELKEWKEVLMGGRVG